MILRNEGPEITKTMKLTPDGVAFGSLLQAKARASIDGVIRLPSGRWIAVVGEKVTPPVESMALALAAFKAWDAMERTP